MFHVGSALQGVLQKVEGLTCCASMRSVVHDRITVLGLDNNYKTGPTLTDLWVKETKKRTSERELDSFQF